MTAPDNPIPAAAAPIADGVLADEELAAFVAAVRGDTGPSARELGADEMRRVSVSASGASRAGLRSAWSGI